MLDSNGNTAELSACYFSSGFAFGLVISEIEFCLLEIAPDPITEVGALDSHDRSIGVIDLYRAIPEDAPGAFEPSRKFFGIESSTQKLVPFVVIGVKPGPAKGICLGREYGVPHAISVLVQGFEAVHIGNRNGYRWALFLESPTIRQSCHFRGEQFLSHLLLRHFSHAPAPFEGKTAFSGGDRTSLVFRH
jgi:hypothetical protein